MDIDKIQNYFFIGIAGTGMSAIAQYLKGIGKEVSGSDRLFEKGICDIEQKLNNEGILTFKQDGSGINEKTSLVVVSSAIEENNIELKNAARIGIPVVHRADLLASLAKTKKTIAVTGTSGKSTTSAMIWHILDKSGIPASFIGGAGLVELQIYGKIGNAVANKGEWLVIEADESDGSLVKYFPEVGIIINIDKDHKEIEELESIFNIFKNQIKGRLIVNQSHPRARSFSVNRNNDFGVEAECGFNAKNFVQEGFKIKFEINNVGFEVPVIGKHNMENAVAAVAACSVAGVDLIKASVALKTYKGIYRRHQFLGLINGVYLIDDYAHNPSKLAASVRACQFGTGNLHLWFQPHGFQPTRFLRYEFVQELLKVLRENDGVWMSEIFYAGGTVSKNISANDLIKDLEKSHQKAYFIENRNEFPDNLKPHLRAGDIVLLTGARDPSLDDFAQFVKKKLMD
ncbi:MAG: Mur ligase family protein [Bacteroidales bacterium]